MTVYGIQFWIECKGGSKTADELSDALDDLIYDGNLSLGYSNHSIIGAGLFMKNAVQNNFESIRKILNEFADKIKYVSEWDYEDSSDMKWGVHTLGESRKSIKESERFPKLDEFKKFYATDDRIAHCEWEDVGRYTIFCEDDVDIEQLAKEMIHDFKGSHYNLYNKSSMPHLDRKYPNHFEFYLKWYESKNSARNSIKESDDFYFEVVFYKDVAKAKEYVKEIYNKFLKKYGYSKNDVTWKLTSNGIGFSSSSENIGFDLEDYILDHMYEYGDYEFETDYELMESKNSARKSIEESVPFTKITWYDDFLSQEMANLIRDKFDVPVSYFSDFDEGVYGIRIKTSDYNSKILNFIKKKVGNVSVLEESKKSVRKSIKESTDDIITVKEFCFWGHSGNIVEIWTIDGVLCDSFEVRNVGKSEYKNYEIHGWDCAKNTVIIYIKK